MSKPTTLERFHSYVVNYELETIELAQRLDNMAQDLTLLKAELEQMIDEERYHRGLNNA